jgi:hypothetical protein
MEQADTLDNRLNWQGQAQVLSSVGTYLAGSAAEASDDDIWEHVVADRQQALGSWQREQEGPQAMLYAGMVAGYDIALTALSDLMGRDFKENSLALS